MANSIKVQIEEDGERNVVAKIVVIADTSDVAPVVVLDPATLYQGPIPTNRLRIDEIQYSVQDGWFVTLLWNATTNKRIVDLNGRGMFPVGPNYGGLQNNAGVGVTGKIFLSTTGYSSGTLVATIILHCVKQVFPGANQTSDPILTELGVPILTESGLELVTE